jgi:hypothetical protein
MRNAVRARHYSRRTENTYVHWTRRFIVFHPRELNQIRHMVLEYEPIIIEAWNEHCGQR